MAFAVLKSYSKRLLRAVKTFGVSVVSSSSLSREGNFPSSSAPVMISMRTMISTCYKYIVQSADPCLETSFRNGQDQISTSILTGKILRTTLENFDPSDEWVQPRLEDFFDEEKPPDISEEDSNEIKSILRWVLQYGATKRPLASEILNDPWFSEIAIKSKAGGDIRTGQSVTTMQRRSVRVHLRT